MSVATSSYHSTVTVRATQLATPLPVTLGVKARIIEGLVSKVSEDEVVIGKRDRD